jgi:cell division protein FtsQ
MTQPLHVHGASVAAPDEGFVDGESPPPAPVRRRRAVAPPEPRSRWSVAWSALKLASGLVIVAGAALAVAFCIHRYALNSPRFSIQAIELSGGDRVGLDELKKLGGFDMGTNLFALDTERAARRLLENPWIEQAKLTRKLPSVLKVELVTREAAALAAIADKLYLVTRSGEPFKELEGPDPRDLPLITGASIENLARDRARELERLERGLDVLRQYERLPLSRSYPAQEVHLADSGDVTLVIGKEGISLRLGQAPFRRKLLMAEQVAGELRRKGRTPGILFLDNVAHPERVVARMK